VLRRVAVNPIQGAKFTVVCFGAFDLKSKGRRARYFARGGILHGLGLMSDALDLRPKPAQ
jgi:hypothetical protein